MKKIFVLMTVLAAMASLLAACAQEISPETIPENTPSQTELAEILPALPVATFEELQSLLGLSDQEAAVFFGASEENWTQDKSTFIGRIYQVSLLEHPVKVYTSCNQENKVASVSTWVTDGTREVTEDEVLSWVQNVSEYTASEPIYDDTTSEAGSRSWKWKKDDIFITVHWLGDIVTIELLPAIGELR